MPNILIVDDEPVVLDVLKRLLEEEGREIALAGTPEEAMRIAQRSPIDVALIDKNLQGASGLDLSRKLKALQPELEAQFHGGVLDEDKAWVFWHNVGVAVAAFAIVASAAFAALGLLPILSRRLLRRMGG